MAHLARLRWPTDSRLRLLHIRSHHHLIALLLLLWHAHHLLRPVVTRHSADNTTSARHRVPLHHLLLIGIWGSQSTLLLLLLLLWSASVRIPGRPLVHWQQIATTATGSSSSLATHHSNHARLLLLLLLGSIWIRSHSSGAHMRTHRSLYTRWRHLTRSTHYSGSSRTHRHASHGTNISRRCRHSLAKATASVRHLLSRRLLLHLLYHLQDVRGRRLTRLLLLLLHADARLMVGTAHAAYRARR